MTQKRRSIDKEGQGTPLDGGEQLAFRKWNCIHGILMTVPCQSCLDELEHDNETHALEALEGKNGDT